MALEPAGKFHEWKGRKQAETTGYPFGNGPPFLDGNGDPVFPEGVAPVVTFTQEDPNPLRVNFKTRGGQAPMTYDFGNGKTHVPADGRDTAHTYEAAGTYQVEVTDAAGQIARTTVTLVAPPAPEPEE